MIKVIISVSYVLLGPNGRPYPPPTNVIHLEQMSMFLPPIGCGSKTLNFGLKSCQNAIKLISTDFVDLKFKLESCY